MPIIGRRNLNFTLKEELTEFLVRELMGESLRRGPVIFEISTEALGEIDALVVWEAWKGLPPSERVPIIREAYARYVKTLEESIHVINPNRAIPTLELPRLKIANGVTWDEVVANELLPYTIQPQARPEEVDPDEIRFLMIETGAIETPNGPELRFPDARLAAEAHSRLMTEMPEARWRVISPG